MYRLGELVRVWRLESRRPLESVAKEIGISLSTLRRLELGEGQGKGGHGGGRNKNGGRGLDGESLARVLTWMLGSNSGNGAS